MKLTKKDRLTLEAMGYTKLDTDQIQVFLPCMKIDCGGKPLTHEQAAELLGSRGWLSGIGRATFHCSASRQTADGKEIGFDCSAAWRRQMIDAAKEREELP